MTVNDDDYTDVLKALNERYGDNRKSIYHYSDSELNRLYMELAIYDLQTRLGTKVFMCNPTEGGR